MLRNKCNKGKNLYNENYKTLMKKIGDTDRKVFHVLRLEIFILLNYLYYTK